MKAAKTSHVSQAPWSDTSRTQWRSLVCDDSEGIDRDIEMLLERVQRTAKCSREEANAKLLRSLSFAA